MFYPKLITGKGDILVSKYSETILRLFDVKQKSLKVNGTSGLNKNSAECGVSPACPFS